MSRDPTINTNQNHEQDKAEDDEVDNITLSRDSDGEIQVSSTLEGPYRRVISASDWEGAVVSPSQVKPPPTPSFELPRRSDRTVAPPPNRRFKVESSLHGSKEGSKLKVGKGRQGPGRRTPMVPS